ncbi:MAG TPA: hypothetical protein VMV94_03465 [Phycisphaerae bacterium]|nr:hypothetical protein [Phycisphaerae bacterium]
MTNSTTQTERRREPRMQADDVIRWKRPGRIEDEKAWMIDRSPNGVGFLVMAERAPKAGDILHIRQRTEGGWTVIDRLIRVARTAPVSSDELVMVGCAME